MIKSGRILLIGLIAGIFPLLVRRGLGLIRKRNRRSRVSCSEGMVTGDSPLASLQREIGDLCSECGACRKTCSFLNQYGTPKSIATHFVFTTSASQAIAYECSLCGLCTAVCPEKLDPARLFLEVRRRCVEDSNLDESAYRTILGYEQADDVLRRRWHGWRHQSGTCQGMGAYP